MKTHNPICSEAGFFSIKGAFLAVIIAAVIFSFFFHLVLTPKNTFVVRKLEPSFEDVFVDTRNWGLRDIWNYRHVIQAIFKSGSSHEIVHLKKYDSAIRSGADTFDEFNSLVGTDK